MKDCRKENRICACCKIEKTKNDFPIVRNNVKKELRSHSYCKECSNSKIEIKRKERRLKEKEIIIKSHTKFSIRSIRHTLANFNKVNNIPYVDYSFITVDWYEALLKEQDNSCGLCEEHVDNFNRKLFVDHCHDTGKIRGLVCHVCNVKLGFFQKTDIEKALKYLQNFAL